MKLIPYSSDGKTVDSLRLQPETEAEAFIFRAFVLTQETQIEDGGRGIVVDVSLVLPTGATMVNASDYGVAIMPKPKP